MARKTHDQIRVAALLEFADNIEAASTKTKTSNDRILNRMATFAARSARKYAEVTYPGVEV